MQSVKQQLLAALAVELERLAPGAGVGAAFDILDYEKVPDFVYMAGGLSYDWSQGQVGYGASVATILSALILVVRVAFITMQSRRERAM